MYNMVEAGGRCHPSDVMILFAVVAAPLFNTLKWASAEFSPALAAFKVNNTIRTKSGLRCFRANLPPSLTHS